LRRLLAIVSVAMVVEAGSAGAQQWVDITPAGGPAPAPRRNAAAVYDSVRHRMVVFGGKGLPLTLGDVWAFDLSTNTWADITPSTGPAPAARLTPDAVVDKQNDAMIMWAGQGDFAVFHNDTWSFDFATETWTQFTPAAPIPNIRYGTASVFDPLAREQVTFAGFTNLGRFDDTWRFSVDADAWTMTSALGPFKRCLHTAVYDAARHRMIMYGGQSSGARDDIWAFDLTTDQWTDLTPVVRPPGRWFAASVYDAINDRMLVFGGNLSGVKVNEVQAFDLATETWGLLGASGTPPSARDGATAIYIAAEDRMVVFGGLDTDLRNDVWSLEDLSPLAAIADPPVTAGVVLHQNAPNPFGLETTIAFDLPRPAAVRLRVFDTQGRQVATLADRAFGAGRRAVNWNGRDDLGRPLDSGVYFYRLEVAGEVRTRALVLQR